MIIGSLRSGGAERVATTLANYWAGKGWDISIVTFADEQSDFYSVAPGVRRIALNRTGDSKNTFLALRNNLGRLWALRRVIQRERPDVALAFMPSSNIQCGLACIGTQAVPVGSEHTHPPMAPSLPRAWRFLRRAVYPRLAAVSALTETSAAWIRENTGARAVPVLPNPIDYPMPSAEPAVDPRAVLPAKREARTLLAVGRLADQKGFDRLLNAFARVGASHPNWQLAVLGEGPLREDLKRQVQVLQLGATVFMPGAVGNIGEWYERADAYVMTSRYEGFGNTLAEALAYGLPSVAVDCETGPRQILRHEVDGLLVSQDDPDALEGALDRLMRDASLRDQFSDRAVEARDRFAVERVAEQWEALFMASIGRGATD